MSVDPTSALLMLKDPGQLSFPVGEGSMLLLCPEALPRKGARRLASASLPVEARGKQTSVPRPWPHQ